MMCGNEKGNAWNDNKATCATMKNKHKQRIEDMHIEEIVVEDEFFEGEELDPEDPNAEAEEDVPFE